MAKSFWTMDTGKNFGTPVSEQDWDQAKDNINNLITPPSASISVLSTFNSWFGTTGNDLACRFDTEDWDTDGMVDLATNDDRITAQTAGRYLVLWRLEASGFTGSFPVDGQNTRLWKNGEAITPYARAVRTSLPVGIEATIHFMVELSVGDYLEVRVAELTTDGNLTVTGRRAEFFFAAHWMGRSA